MYKTSQFMLFVLLAVNVKGACIVKECFQYISIHLKIICL